MTRQQLIDKIESLPARLRRAVSGASAQQLDRPYRAGGWTARQVVHHLADSHMNAYIRCRLILTEHNPPLKPYDQDTWAALPDAASGPIAPSLAALDGIHARWAAFFQSLPEEAWSRQGYHPEFGAVSLERILDSYAAHGERHLQHIATGLGIR